MEESVQRAESLLKQGKFKESYELYLRIASFCSNSLLTESSWCGQDLTDTKHLTLLNTASSSFRKAQEISNARLVIPKKIPLTPSTTITNFTNPTYHPYIPLSRLTRKYIQQTSIAAEAQQRYNHVQTLENVPLPELRRIIEDLNINKAKLTTLTQKIDSASTLPIQSINPTTLALQITLHDSRLFSKIHSQTDLISTIHPNHIITSNPIKACLDWNIYLERIFIDLILSSSMDMVIQITFILFHVYRNLNAVNAGMKALTCPQVSRSRKGVDGRCMGIYKHLLQIVPATEVPSKTHVDQTKGLLADGAGMSVIPFLGSFVEEVGMVYKNYVSGYEGGVPLLSDIGIKYLTDMKLVIDACQGKVKYPDVKPIKYDIKSLWGDTLPSIPTDLSGLNGFDEVVDHWLLTRIFWSRDDLFQKSVNITPLGPREIVPSFQEVVVEVVDEENEVRTLDLIEDVDDVDRELRKFGMFDDDDDESK